MHAGPAGSRRSGGGTTSSFPRRWAPPIPALLRSPAKSLASSLGTASCLLCFACGLARSTFCFRRVCLFQFQGFPYFVQFPFLLSFRFGSVRLAPLYTVATFGPSTMRASLRPSDPAVSPAIERVNAELFTLTYGAIVRQLLTDYEEIEEVNKQLDTMGYNIGARLIDDFLAKANITKCTDFRETADVIAKVGFKMFLSVTATVTNWSADNMECSLILEDNPLVDFVELPETCQGLSYCNILCGVLRGALEMVSMRTEVKFVKDMLRGDDVFEIRLKLLEQMPEEYPYKNDE